MSALPSAARKRATRPSRSRRGERPDLFLVEPQHLLVERAVAALRGGHAAALERSRPTVSAPSSRELGHHGAAGLVVADHRKRDGAATQRHDVGDDVAGAAERASVSLFPCSTGIGASGEMRSMTPLTKRSRMKSPTTSTVTAPKPADGALDLFRGRNVLLRSCWPRAIYRNFGRRNRQRRLPACPTSLSAAGPHSERVKGPWIEGPLRASPCRTAGRRCALRRLSLDWLRRERTTVVPMTEIRGKLSVAFPAPIGPERRYEFIPAYHSGGVIGDAPGREVDLLPDRRLSARRPAPPSPVRLRTR